MFSLVAARRGDHWRLAPNEANDLGSALAGVVKHVPLPERELGIAADLAALGFVCFAIAQPRIEHDRRLALAGVATMPTGAPQPAGVEDVGVQRMERVLRERLGGVPIDLRNPQHVALLNELADEGLIATGSAVGGGGQPQFTNTDPATNGAIVNDPTTVIVGLDPS